MSDNIKNLKSTVLIDPAVAANFRLIADRRASVERNLQIAIDAAVKSAQELSLVLDDEQRALFDKIIEASGHGMRLTWSVDASDPNGPAYLFDMKELQSFNAGEAPAPGLEPAGGPLHITQEALEAIKKDLEAEVGGPVTLEQLQTRIDETFGANVAFLQEGGELHVADEKKVEQVFSPD